MSVRVYLPCHLVSFTLHRSSTVKTISLCIMQSTARLLTPPVLSPPLSALPEVSLLTFRCFTFHLTLPHFPRSACCVLLTLASSAWTTKDALLPSHVPLFSGFIFLPWSNNTIIKEKVIRCKTLMTGGSAWQHVPFTCTENQSALGVPDIW